MSFIRVYYIEFPIRIRGFPNEIRYFCARTAMGPAAAVGPGPSLGAGAPVGGGALNEKKASILQK